MNLILRKIGAWVQMTFPIVGYALGPDFQEHTQDSSIGTWAWCHSDADIRREVWATRTWSFDTLSDHGELVRSRFTATHHGVRTMIFLVESGIYNYQSETQEKPRSILDATLGDGNPS